MELRSDPTIPMGLEQIGKGVSFKRERGNTRRR
jgi:hypothetical protein